MINSGKESCMATGKHNMQNFYLVRKAREGRLVLQAKGWMEVTGTKRRKGTLAMGTAWSKSWDRRKDVKFEGMRKASVTCMELGWAGVVFELYNSAFSSFFVCFLIWAIVMQLKLASNSLSSYLHLQSAGIIALSLVLKACLDPLLCPLPWLSCSLASFISPSS
jgi:hypothetical protein